MARRVAAAEQKRDRSGALTGAQGEPISAYLGWDADEGVFRLDCSIADLEERYRRIAEGAETEDAFEVAERDAEAPRGPAQPTRAPTPAVST